jgi:hypothetical protein
MKCLRSPILLCKNSSDEQTNEASVLPRIELKYGPYGFNYDKLAVAGNFT